METFRKAIVDLAAFPESDPTIFLASKIGILHDIDQLGDWTCKWCKGKGHGHTSCSSWLRLRRENLGQKDRLAYMDSIVKKAKVKQTYNKRMRQLNNQFKIEKPKHGKMEKQFFGV